MATVNPIASGDAFARSEPCEFTTNDERCSRLISAPGIASLLLNPAAPPSSLIALALTRVLRSMGTVDLVCREIGDESLDRALTGVFSNLQELEIILLELQRQDGLQYSGAVQ